MIKGIIFDKDGVLFDSEPVYAKLILGLLKELGYNFTEEDYFEHWTRKGGNVESFFDMHNIKADIFEFRKMLEFMIDKEFKTDLRILSGVPEVLKGLNDIYPMALATASDRNSTELKLRLSGFDRYFKHVITKEDVVKRKPDPEAFLLASKRLGIKPSDLVVIEDAEKGVIAAKMAGMKCIAIPTRHTKEHDFSLADKVLDNITNLTPELIRGL